MPLSAADLPPTHAVAAEFAFDTTFVAWARYGRGIADALGERDLLAGVNVTVPIFATSGVSDWKVEVDAATLLPVRGGVGVEVTGATGLGRATDAAGRMIGWTGGVRVRPGWFGARGRVTLDAAWLPTLATHVARTDLVTALYDDRPADAATTGPATGWYRGGAGRFQLGVAGAWQAKSRLFLGRGGGWSRAAGPLPSFPDIGVLPFTTHLHGGWQW